MQCLPKLTSTFHNRPRSPMDPRKSLWPKLASEHVMYHTLTALITAMATFPRPSPISGRAPEHPMISAPPTSSNSSHHIRRQDRSTGCISTVDCTNNHNGQKIPTLRAKATAAHTAKGTRSKARQQAKQSNGNHSRSARMHWPRLFTAFSFNSLTNFISMPAIWNQAL